MATNTDMPSPLSSDVVTFLETLYSPLSAMEIRSEAQPTPNEFPETSLEMPVTAILAYDSIDDEYKRCIVRELRTLKRQGCPISWIEYNVDEATELFTDIEKPLRKGTYELFLFLLSPEFLDRDEWYGPDICNLIDNHKKGIWISPILLRTCRWEKTPFGRKNSLLPILPNPQQPIKKWADEDDAYKVIAGGIETAIEYLRNHRN